MGVLARTRVIIVGVLVGIGLFSALGRFLLPEASHLALANVLYGADFVRIQFPIYDANPGPFLTHILGGSPYFLFRVTSNNKHLGFNSRLA